MQANRTLAEAEKVQLVASLKASFDQHPERHPDIAWEAVLQRLERSGERLWSLNQMEATGGAPDVIGRDASGAYVFCDCSPQTPAGRRNLCYDAQALAQRKKNKPQGSAVELAESMGIELLNEQQYLELQALGDFDSKTSSWLATPEAIRARGGALFGDRRFDRAFVYHNGADSYYAARGFRGLLRV